MQHMSVDISHSLLPKAASSKSLKDYSLYWTFAAVISS